MREWLSRFFFGCAVILPVAAGAQVKPAAVGPGTHLWVGGEYSNFQPDWGVNRLPGIGIYADVTAYGRYGLEGEARFLNFTKPLGLTEKSYLGGPIYTLYRRHRLTANAKGLIGAGLVTYTEDFGYGSYFEYALGGNIEYRLAHKWKARFDYEYQSMPSAPGAILPPGESHGLTPSGFSGGVSYRVF